jgi:hypothetical protein
MGQRLKEKTMAMMDRAVAVPLPESTAEEVNYILGLNE